MFELPLPGEITEPDIIDIDPQDNKLTAQRLELVIHHALEQQLAGISSKLTQELVRAAKELATKDCTTEFSGPLRAFQSGHRSVAPALGQVQDLGQRKTPCAATELLEATLMSEGLAELKNLPRHDWSKRAYKTNSQKKILDRARPAELNFLGTPKCSNGRVIACESTGEIQNKTTVEPFETAEMRHMIPPDPDRVKAIIREKSFPVIIKATSTKRSSAPEEEEEVVVPLEVRHLRSSTTLPELVFQRPLARIVLSETFDWVTGFAILLCTIFIGIKHDYMLQNRVWFVDVCVAFELTFCAFFVVEISLRLFVFRSFFFTMEGWEWNLADLILTVYQVLQEIGEYFWYAHRNDISTFWHIHRPPPLAFYLRFFRFSRLLRLIRLARVKKYFAEFHIMASSAFQSVRYLVWACMILFMFIYVVAVHIAFCLGRYALQHPGAIASGTLLNKHWGSVAKCILSLFQAVTGGEDWNILLSPLMEVSVFSSVWFSLYICFTSLFILNIINGVFVEVAMSEAHLIGEANVISNLRAIFKGNGDECNGQITLQEFLSHLDNPHMKGVFDAINLDVDEAENLFTLLDVDRNGNLSYDEFMTGCLRLRGSAKSIDVATLMYEGRRTHLHVQAMHTDIVRLAQAFEIECEDSADL